MRWKFLSMWFDTTCVSYALILIVFSVFDVASDKVGPLTWGAALQLGVMCALIAVWTSFLRTRRRLGAGLFLLLAYAGCAGVVLGLGNATGFIPLSEGDGRLIGMVLIMITAVFVATAFFAGLQEKSRARQINERLRRLRENAKDESR